MKRRDPNATIPAHNPAEPMSSFVTIPAATGSPRFFTGTDADGETHAQRAVKTTLPMPVGW